MSSRQTSLQRYYPYLIAGTAALALGLASYRLYTNRTQSSPSLRRSNATRRSGLSNPRRRQQNRAADTPSPEPGGELTNEQLFDALNQPGDSEELPLNIPEAAAEALRETGHAAQQARGARGAVASANEREGRAGRRAGDVDSEFSFTADTKENTENQNLLTLLYTIAQDTAQRESYVHRGVTCNNCQIIPIRGIRYRCANCLDYDLCEVCEALDACHPKTHLFYKIRIPAPFIGNPRHAQAPCYPGKPHLMPQSLGMDAIRVLVEETKFEQVELEALYEQFKVQAASEHIDPKFGINGAISRDTFDKCFIPNTYVHPPAPNLIYDRMFRFYDANGDGMIDFEEFVMGVALTNNKSKTHEKLKRIFDGYDLDGDGYVERKDFLRMFKSFYSLSKVLVKDIVASLGDELYEQGHMEQALNGRQPISAVFTSSIPPAGRSWDKPVSAAYASDFDVGSPVVLPSSRDHMDAGELQRALDSSESPGIQHDTVRGKRIEAERRAGFWALMDMDEYDLMLPEEERDIGSEAMFQLAIRGINELLDLLFKRKEWAAIEVKMEDGGPAEGKLREEKHPNGKNKQPMAESSETETAAEAASPREQEGETNEDKPEEISQEEGDMIAAMREEIKERGGEGRLNFEEFKEIMTGSESARLEFVGTWTDLAGF